MPTAGASPRCAWRCRFRPSRRSTNRRRTVNAALQFGAGLSRGGMAQPADLGRQEIRPAFAAAGIRGQGEPDLHRPAVRHRRGFFIHGDSAGRSGHAKRTIRSRSPKSRASSSTKPTATRGGAGWIHICNGFTKPPYCSMNCCMRTAASMCIWTGMSVIMRKLFLMKYSAQNTFVNEIVWKRTYRPWQCTPGAQHMVRITTSSFFTRRRKTARGITQYVPYDPKITLTSHYRHVEDEDRADGIPTRRS